MASTSKAKVESMIEAAIGKFEVRVGEALVQLEKDQLSRADARSGLELMSNQIKEEFAVQRQRINELTYQRVDHGQQQDVRRAQDRHRGRGCDLPQPDHGVGLGHQHGRCEV